MVLPEQTAKALKAWLAVRSVVVGPDGPLFVSKQYEKWNRMPRGSMNAMLEHRAKQVGHHLEMHDLRRILCTDAIAELGIYEALKVTRHADVSTLGLYDLGAGVDLVEKVGRVAARVASRTGEKAIVKTKPKKTRKKKKP